MKVDVLLGLQWGDEGKGKIVDVLSPKYDVIARFQGGPNAGHSLEFNNKKYVLHSIPSGIFHKNSINVIGNGVVIDPVIFKKEIDGLEKECVDIKKKLLISKKAHLILPSHRVLDAASEAAKGKTKIGSTLKGIGPTYMDKTGRNGIRVGDIEYNLKDKYQKLYNKHRQILEQYDFQYDISEYEKLWFEGIELIKEFELIDSEYTIDQYLEENKKILAEGAQGTLLDIDFGTYPYVTSSNTVSAGACTGLGVSPKNIGEVYGIFKAYCTRVGSGPFFTEIFDETGKKLQKYGHEYGATTGRERRCGWLDLIALKYSVKINGVTQLIITKADVLSYFDKIKIGIAYKINDKISTKVPFDNQANIEVVYKEFKGWKTDVTKVRKYNDLPNELISFIKYIENEVGVPIKIISLGPDRAETIIRSSTYL